MTQEILNAVNEMKTDAAKVLTEVAPETKTSLLKVKGIIDVENHSNKLSNDQIQPLLDAVQKQLDNEVLQYWGYTARFNLLPMGVLNTDKTHWKMGVFDESDEPGDAGWHDDESGQVIIEVFNLGTPNDTAITISHEALESITDTDANTTVEGLDPSGRPCIMYLEPADPVEDDSYAIDGIQVSNFVMPTWFKLPSVDFTPDARFDFLQKVTKEFEILPGGYMQYSYDNGKTWTEVNVPANAQAKKKRGRPPKS